MLNATLLLTVEDDSVDADALQLRGKCSMAYLSDTAVLYCRMRHRGQEWGGVGMDKRLIVPESESSGVIV